MTQFFEPLLQPIGILWLIHLVGAIWMARRRKWGEMIFCATIAAAILLIGSTRLPTRLLASLERPYANQNLTNLPHCDAVVMLGGTLTASSGDVLGFDLGEAADRIITAVEVFSQKKADTLVLGGGWGKSPDGSTWSEGDVLMPWLAKQGVTGTNYLRLRNCANTHEEAIEVAALAKERRWQRIVLVTSGYHMKRASGLFAKVSVPFEPVACDFIGLSSLENEKRFRLFPELGKFHHLELFLHEWIGWHYYRLRGWVEIGLGLNTSHVRGAHAPPRVPVGASPTALGAGLPGAF